MTAPKWAMERSRVLWLPIRDKLNAVCRLLQYPVDCLDHITDDRVKPHLLVRSEAFARVEQIAIPEPTWIAEALAAERATAHRDGWQAAIEASAQIARDNLAPSTARGILDLRYPYPEDRDA